MLLAIPVLLAMFAWSTLPDKKYSLVYAVYDAQAASNHVVHVRKVTFSGGVPSAPENIMDIVTQQPGDRVPRIRFDLGPNSVYRNRWVITSYGNVIDLQEKKVLVDQHDRFVRASGDSLVFFTNDITKGKYYSVLDLKTGRYEQVKNPAFRALPGKDVEADCALKNYKIYYYPPSAPKVEVVKDAGFGEDVSLIAGARPQLPMHWIDNDNFLYPNYSSAHDYVSIMKVTLSTKTQEKIGEIDRLPENHALSRFYTTTEGEIIYQCARGHFSIDVAKKKATELQYLPAGHGFSIAIAETPKGRAIRNDEQTIGTYFCFPEQAVSAPGHVAFPYEMVLGEEHYLQGVAVWSQPAGKWKTVGDSDLSAVIGWVEE